ncbi:MAG: hypothetical protein ACRD15_06630, partial [Vicinamibacterales bacterium]
TPQGRGRASVAVTTTRAGKSEMSVGTAPLLFGVTAHDPRALAAGVLALAIVSVMASAIPARQAARIDPIEAIRGE